jgi:hypothetical protein
MTTLRESGGPSPQDRLAGAATAVVVGSSTFLFMLVTVASVAAGEVHVPGAWLLMSGFAAAGAVVIVGTAGLVLSLVIDRLLAGRSTSELSAAYALTGLLVGAVVAVFLAGFSGAFVIFPVAGALAGLAGGLASHRGASRLRLAAVVSAVAIAALVLPPLAAEGDPFIVVLAAIAVLGVAAATTWVRPGS